MKFIIELPDNYAHAYMDLLPHLYDGVTLEESIARESKEFVQRMLYHGWDILDPEFEWPPTRVEVQERGKQIAARIILKHKIPEEE